MIFVDGVIFPLCVVGVRAYYKRWRVDLSGGNNVVFVLCGV